MIEDDELRELFKTESAEHLQNLDTGLLRLEKNPDDRELLEEVFREAHSLKGSARMLSLTHIEALAHRLEDTLGAVKKGQSALTPEVIDQISSSLKDIRILVHEAITGENAGATVPDASRHLPEADLEQQRTEEIHPELRNTESEQPEIEQIRAPDETQQPQAQSAGSKFEEFRIDTIRVETRKLDTLMTQLGELSVTTKRVSHRLAGMEELLTLWEELRAGSVSLCGMAREVEHNTPNGALDKLLHCIHRRQEVAERLGDLLGSVTSAAHEDSSKLDFIVGELEDGARSVRLLPLSTIFSLFPRMVRDMAREQSKEIELLVEGGEITADKRIIEEIKDPLMHMIRNSIDHGIEPPDVRERRGKPRCGSIVLRAYQTATNIVLEVKDNGRGLDVDAVKQSAVKRGIYRKEETSAMSLAQIQSLIFVSGFSTSPFISDVSGRGVGLDVVRTNVERLKGTVQVESAEGEGCTLRIQLPITLATTRVLILTVNHVSYAVPVEYVETARFVQRHEIFTLEGRNAMMLYDRPISVAYLSDLLELGSEESEVGNPASKIQNPRIPCTVISVGEAKLGLLVDAVLDEQEIVLKPQSLILKRVRNVSGATILGTGEVCIVLNPSDLIRSVRRRELTVTTRRKSTEDKEKQRKKVILLVEDSITTLTQMKRILEGAHYEIVTAVDGVDAFNKLGGRSFDALVTDIQMPNMDGLTLTARVRRDRKYQELPIILVTSLTSDEDRKKGVQAGANAYITKPAFDQKVLLDTLERLI